MRTATAVVLVLLTADLARPAPPASCPPPRPVAAPCPAPYLPPPLPSERIPSEPRREGEPRQTERERADTDRQQQAPSTDAFAQAPEAGTASPASYSPNLYGDIFGSRAFAVVLPRPPIIIPGTPGTPGTPPTPGMTQNFGGTFTLPGTTTPARFVGEPVAGQTPPGTVGVLFLNLRDNAAALPGINGTFGPPLTHQSTGPVPIGSLTTGSVVALQEQPEVRTAVVNQVGPNAMFVNSNALLVAQNRGLPSEYTITTLYLLNTPGTPGTPIVVIPQAPIVFLAPSPSGGGVVGRTKLADDNNPLPRDRVIFNYDYFNAVPLGFNGVDVHRFSPGFEKTFFNQMASIEVRVPFASTLNSDIRADGLTPTGRVELGDVHLTLKMLLWGGTSLNVAGGLGIDLPTADDVRARLADGTELIRLNNDAVILTPYFAYLWTPTERLFFQNWYAFPIDANGNRALANLDLTGLRDVGRLTDPSLFQLDAQLGYWLVRDDGPSARVRGLAPFVELHYNATLGNPDRIQAGAFALGAFDGRINELNLTTGLVAQFGDNVNLSVGVVVPLLPEPDRTFDYQIGVRGNVFFGPTARDRSRARAIQASSF